MKNVRKLMFSAAVGAAVLVAAATAQAETCLQVFALPTTVTTTAVLPLSAPFAVQTLAAPGLAVQSVVPVALVRPLASQRAARQQRVQVLGRRTPLRSLLFGPRRAVRVRNGCS